MSVGAQDVSLDWVHRDLRQTGRGKHVGQFSYYHTHLTTRLPRVQACLNDIKGRLYPGLFDFNVVKLGRRSRISFLLYEDFTTPFPALLRALTCDLAHGTTRLADYRGRPNPPILHRKELLLPGDDPLVPAAVLLTERLEQLGAFANSNAIGTRQGWQAALEYIGLNLVDDRVPG